MVKPASGISPEVHMSLPFKKPGSDFPVIIRWKTMRWTLAVLNLATVMVLLKRKSDCFFEATVPVKANIHAIHWNPSLPVTYGLVHMARSGGSVINHILALKYERVCGNKGYSYNAYEKNEQKRLHPPVRNKIKVTRKSQVKFMKNQGKIIEEAIYSSGFDDCDYIAMEIKAYKWQKHMGDLHRPLELHVPCRDPVDHLMSMCAYHKEEFSCNLSNEELHNKIENCTERFLNRFTMDMAPSPNFTMKCFSAPSKINDYIEYMGETLQKKRIQGEYFDITSNKWERHKETECIWEEANKDFRKLVEFMIINHHEYFRYCKDCIGSENDLLR